MKATIDKAGRLVVPKAIRDAARLKPGTEVEFRLVDGRVQMEPAPLDVQLEQRGKFLVAVPRESPPALTTAEVNETIRELRESSAQDERS